MKFRINVERTDVQMTVSDSFVVRGNTAEECEEEANAWLRQHGLMNGDEWAEGVYCWSQQL